MKKTYNSNTEEKRLRNFKEYTYKNLYTGQEEVIFASMIPKLIKEYIEYAQQEEPVHPGAFFLSKNIPVKVIENLRGKFPDLEDAWQFVKEIIRYKREKLLLNDFTYLRNTQAMFNPELKAFEEERLRLKVSIQKAVDKEGAYSLEQIQAVIQYCFPPLTRNEVNTNITPTQEHENKVAT